MAPTDTVGNEISAPLRPRRARFDIALVQLDLGAEPLQPLYEDRPAAVRCTPGQRHGPGCNARGAGQNENRPASCNEIAVRWSNMLGRQRERCLVFDHPVRRRRRAGKQVCHRRNVRVGDVLRISVSCVTILVVISGNASFFATTMGMSPSDGTPPLMRILSIISFHRPLAGASAASGRRVQPTAIADAFTGTGGSRSTRRLAPRVRRIRLRNRPLFLRAPLFLAPD